MNLPIHRHWQIMLDRWRRLFHSTLLLIVISKKTCSREHLNVIIRYEEVFPNNFPCIFQKSCILKNGRIINAINGKDSSLSVQYKDINGTCNMQMHLAASRSRDEIFLFTRCGDVTFYRAEKELNSVRIIAITRINLHSELASCKHLVSCARCVITVKWKSVAYSFPINIGSVIRWELTNAETTNYVYLFQNFSRDETFSGSRGNHPSSGAKILRGCIARMIRGSMSSIWLRV